MKFKAEDGTQWVTNIGRFELDHPDYIVVRRVKEKPMPAIYDGDFLVASTVTCYVTGYDRSYPELFLDHNGENRIWKNEIRKIYRHGKLIWSKGDTE